MEEQTDDTNLETIITVLENIESQNMSEDEQIQNWLESITNPEFQLVDSLINLFMDNIQDASTTTNIFKVLRKFNIYQKENVLPQMKSNPKFPIAIYEYITKTEKDLISGDAFYLLSSIFKVSNFKEVINAEFINALFDGLDTISDEENFYAIVNIITAINFELKSSPFLEVYKSHKNSGVLVETLIRILNREKSDKKIMYRILKCFIDIIEATGDVMYSSDLESFINLTIDNLESTYTYELRYYFLKVLEKITQNDEYFKTRYKINLLEDLLDSYINHHDLEEDLKELCKIILNNLYSK